MGHLAVEPGPSSGIPPFPLTYCNFPFSGALGSVVVNTSDENFLAESGRRTLSTSTCSTSGC